MGKKKQDLETELRMKKKERNWKMDAEERKRLHRKQMREEGKYRKARKTRKRKKQKNGSIFTTIVLIIAKKKASQETDERRREI